MEEDKRRKESCNDGWMTAEGKKEWRKTERRKTKEVDQMKERRNIKKMIEEEIWQ